MDFSAHNKITFCAYAAMRCIPFTSCRILIDNSYAENNGLTILLAFCSLASPQTYMSCTLTPKFTGLLGNMTNSWYRDFLTEFIIRIKGSKVKPCRPHSLIYGDPQASSCLLNEPQLINLWEIQRCLYILPIFIPNCVKRNAYVTKDGMNLSTAVLDFKYRTVCAGQLVVLKSR